MAASNTTIDQLNETAQHTALETFAKFYLDRFLAPVSMFFPKLIRRGI